MAADEKLTILGEKIIVKYVDLISEDISGDADVVKRTIRIEKKLNSKERQRVLAHEQFHMKLGLSGLSDLLDPKMEEALCTLAEIE